MAALTDGGIRKAIGEVAVVRKERTLADGEGHGTGRLTLILKPMPNRVTAVWYAVQWRDAKRTKVKLGDYPSMSLAKARELFDRDYAAPIQRKTNIKLAGDTRPGTIADLFEAYPAALKADGKRSADDIKKILDKVAVTLGPNRPARDITAEEVIEVLRPIYERGAPSMADHTRSMIRSAFSWGIKAELDYRTKSPRRFRLRGNPAADIPGEKLVVGTRWLDEDEFAQTYLWLVDPPSIHPPYARAKRLLMLTGQRVEEVVTLHKDQYVREEKIIDWSRTKNGRPHAIPLGSLAVDLLDSITPNEYGWFFPAAFDPSKSVSHGTLYSSTWRLREFGYIPHASNRDLRRTWKTLAGKAGLSKEIRDRLQNHALQDVSSKNYDRYSYMPEKRAAMEQWDRYVVDLLARYKERQLALEAA